MSEPLLQVQDLTVAAVSGRRQMPIVRDVSFAVAEGETVAIVGESGSGKSLTVLAIMGLLGSGLKIVSGRVVYRGVDLAQADSRRLRRLRGREMAMVYQDPMTSLNPLLKIGDQVAETLTAHGVPGSEAHLRSLEALARVGLPDPRRNARAYPHEFSGGMRQRALIATALVMEPRLLIADEPTTALDVTIQQQILALIKGLQQDTNLTTVWITHDLGVVANLVDRVLVMYAGRIVEDSPVRHLFTSPQHPYTAALLASLPRLTDASRPPLAQIPGSPPQPGSIPPGCSFHPRCAYSIPRCETDPPLLERGAAQAACWIPPAEWVRQ